MDFCVLIEIFVKNCYDIDLDIYCDGSVRDSRWRVNFAASLFKN